MKRIYRVYKKTVSMPDETPTMLYENLAGGQTGFLLESYDRNYDRYTLLGTEPEELITSEENELVIRKRNGETERRPGNPLVRLKEYYDEFEIRNDNSGFGFSGGLVGSLGYDFVRYTETLPESGDDEIGIGTVQLMLVKAFLVIDCVAETLTAVVLGEDGGAGKEQALLQAKELIKRALGQEKNSRDDGQIRQYQRNQQKEGSGGRIIKKSDTPDSYCGKVEKIKKYIREGHIFQTVLSQRWTVETERDGFSLYQELRNVNPSPYLYYFNFGSFEIIGSSPEMLVKQQEKHVYTCPIAGTRPRGKTATEDDRWKRELSEDEKERAEHVMLVDLARNDMGRISEFGTVKVTDFMRVQNYSHVMHLVSRVEGLRREGFHPLDLLASFLPAGTLSGAPKIRAMEIIAELEENKRGLYGGATGYVDFSGDMDFCITIRTMIKKGARVYLQAGAGIVADSIPEKEYEECRNKVMALAKTLVEEEEL